MLAEPTVVLAFILVHAIQDQLTNVIQNSRLSCSMGTYNNLYVLRSLPPASIGNVSFDAPRGLQQLLGG